MANEEMIRKVVKNIEDYNRWDQNNWAAVGEDLLFADDTPFDIFAGIETYEYDDETYYLFDTQLVREGACNTSFCFAGHTVLAAGDKILMSTYGDATFCLTPEGDKTTIEARARDLLDIPYEVADRLFHHSTGNGDFEEYKRILTERTGVTFDEVPAE